MRGAAFFADGGSGSASITENAAGCSTSAVQTATTCLQYLLRRWAGQVHVTFVVSTLGNATVTR